MKTWPRKIMEQVTGSDNNIERVLKGDTVESYNDAKLILKKYKYKMNTINRMIIMDTLKPSDRLKLEREINAIREAIAEIPTLVSKINETEEKLSAGDLSIEEQDKLNAELVELLRKIDFYHLSQDERMMYEHGEKLEREKSKKVKWENINIQLENILKFEGLNLEDNVVNKSHYVIIPDIITDKITDYQDRIEHNLNNNNLLFVYNLKYQENDNSLIITCYNKLHNLNYNQEEAIYRQKKEIIKVLMSLEFEDFNSIFKNTMIEL